MKEILHDPWYLASIGFIILGIYLLKLWRKSIAPNDSPWDRMLTEKTYFIKGIGAIAFGVITIIILLQKDLQ